MIDFRVSWIESEERWCVNSYVEGTFHSLEYFSDTEEMTQWLDLLVKNH